MKSKANEKKKELYIVK